VGFFSFESPGGYVRQALLVCDACDHFYAKGARSTRAKRDALPHEWAPFFEFGDVLWRIARDAGWRYEAGRGADWASGRWLCPDCVPR
jgi:hypothetical protein